MSPASPDCPLCGHPPHIGFPTQYFCGNEECALIMWDPTLPLAELRRQIAEDRPEDKIDLSGLPDLPDPST